MNKVVKYFLERYPENDLVLRNRMTLLLYINGFALILLPIFYGIQSFSTTYSNFQTIGNILVFVSGFASLIFIRKGSSVLAIHCIYGPLLAYIFQKVLDDLFSNRVQFIENIYETITFCIISMVVLCLISNRIRHAIAYTISCLILFLSHYMVIIYTHYNGVIGGSELGYLIIGVINILVTGMAAIASLMLYNGLTRLTENALKESQEKYHNLFLKINDGYALIQGIEFDRNVNLKIQFRDYNVRFYEYLSLKEEDLKSLLSLQRLSALHSNVFRCLKENTSVQFEIQNEINQRWLRVSLQPQDNHFIVVLVRDITERKKKLDLLMQESSELEMKNEELRHISTTDSLTGLLNRKSFEELFHKRIVGTEVANDRLTLILLDIDFFKFYNDTYGHLRGDECLKRVAECLFKSLHRSDDFVGRYGGEEFIVFLENSNQEDSLVVAERIRSNIENLKIPHEKSGISPFVTVSLGVHSFVLNNDADFTELIGRCDKALYSSKQKGRNRVSFYEEE